MVISGGALSITTPDGQRRIALGDHPALMGLATTLTAALAGDLPALEKLYGIEATGSLKAWRLVLRPHGSALAHFVTSITLDGQDSALRLLQIVQANGDTETMRVQPLP